MRRPMEKNAFITTGVMVHCPECSEKTFLMCDTVADLDFGDLANLKSLLGLEPWNELDLDAMDSLMVLPQEVECSGCGMVYRRPGCDEPEDNQGEFETA